MVSVLEFVRQYAAKNWRVIATCRQPDAADLLQALAADNTNITVEQLDVLDHKGIENLAEAYKAMPIDVLLNNAGIMGDENHQSLGQFDFRSLQKVMDTNAVGPLKMAEAFIDHVSASAQKKIMNVSSAGGSLSTAKGGGRYFYRASKTALNGFMRNLAVDVVDRGIIIGLLSPGRVLNDAMREAIRKANITLETIEPKVSITGMIDVIDQFTPDTSGAFIGHTGNTIPW